MVIARLFKYVSALLISWMLLSLNVSASSQLTVNESFEREIVNLHARLSVAPTSATYFDVLNGNIKDTSPTPLLLMSAYGIPPN